MSPFEKKIPKGKRKIKASKGSLCGKAGMCAGKKIAPKDKISSRKLQLLPYRFVGGRQEIKETTSVRGCFSVSPDRRMSQAWHSSTA